MARSFFGFDFRSKDELAEDAKNYGTWAFPHGQVQKQCVQQLLGQLLPKHPESDALFIYLNGRESYWGSSVVLAGCAANREAATKRLKKLLPARHKAALPLLLALIEADATIGEELSYPDIEQLTLAAARFE